MINQRRQNTSSLKRRTLSSKIVIEDGCLISTICNEITIHEEWGNSWHLALIQKTIQYFQIRFDSGAEGSASLSPWF